MKIGFSVVAVDAAISLIKAERSKQIAVKGYSADHDDEHWDGSMLDAARCYLTGSPVGWPWGMRSWCPKTMERNVVRAGALALAEVDRLTRAGAGAGALAAALAVHDAAVKHLASVRSPTLGSGAPIANRSADGG